MKFLSKRRAALIAGAAGLVLALPAAAFAATGAPPEIEGALTLDNSSTWYASGQFVVQNTSGGSQPWKLSFSVPEGSFANSSSWNIDASVDGDTVTLTPKSGSLAAGQSEYISFGISGDGSAALSVLECDLNGSGVAGCSVDGGGGGEDSEKPSTPLNVTADAMSDSAIHVMWDHSTDNVGIDGYRIFQDGEQVKEVDKVTRMTNISGLTAGTSYEFEVQAFDAAGNDSGRSTPVTGTTHDAPVEDTEAPSTVTGITATSTGPHTADVKWEAASDNIGVTSYLITDGKGGTTTVGAGTSATVTGLTAATTYDFTVYALDAADNKSEASIAVPVLTDEDNPVEPGTGVPLNFTASPNSYTDGDITIHRLQLGWTPAEATTRYEVYVDGEYVQTLLVGSDQELDQKRYIVLGTESGTHTVKIRAKLADGSWSAFTPELSVTN